MKKILFTMAVFFGFATMSFSQNNYVATLQHEGEFTHYYGSGALTSAYNAATEGDIITLSPGTFSSPGTIDKGITLRGTGSYATAKSYVSGNVTFCSTKNSRITTIEGVWFNSQLSVQNNSAGDGQGEIRFIKNWAEGGIFLNSANTYSTTKGPKIRLYNMRIGCEFRVESNSYPDFFVYNSWVPNIHSYFGQTTSAFINCIIYYENQYAESAHNMNFYNCIIESNNSNRWLYFPNSVTCYNCLNYGKLASIFNKLLNGGNNKYVTSEIFNNNEGHSLYELTPEAQETYLGTDGTQVGVYGGNYPWNTDVQYPVITQFNTDVQTSKEGILNINVEVDGK